MKVISRKKNGAGGIRPPDFRLYYKAIVIKIACYLNKNRNIDQQNRIEIPEIIIPFNYGQTRTKEARLHNGAKTAFSTNGPGKTRQLHVKKMILDDFLTPYTKINSNELKI